ncbi:MAG: hypothetical protein ACREVL_08410, partial [Solimonas sp.]
VVGYALWNFAGRFFPKLRRGGAAAKGGGCADCDSCGSCDTPTATPGKDTPHEQVVRFHGK